MVETYQGHALRTRLGIPLIYGVDAVHGHNNVLGAVIFPHNIGLGCTRNPALVEKVARVTAEEMRATGINWAFAPCVAVPQDIRWGRTYEGIREDPGLFASWARRRCAASRARPLGSAGRARLRQALRGATAARVRLRRAVAAALRSGRHARGRSHAAPHPLAGHTSPRFAAGVGTIMPSYSSWNGVKCSASKQLLTDILKDELGFEGFLISDYNAIDQIAPATTRQPSGTRSTPAWTW